MYTLNCKGKLIHIDSPIVMGIINATFDSFYEGHLSQSNHEIVDFAGKMIEDGASILDIGGQSSRPGSIQISAEEELERAIPLIELLHQHFPDTLLSVDSFYSKVAQAAVDAGASIVNDISAGNMDTAMIETVASLQVPYICMHMKGIPATMHHQPLYEDVVKEVIEFFIDKTTECIKAGIKDVIIDPGFGFGKTMEHNFVLLKELNSLHILGKPILAGLSRKSTIYKTLGITANEALNGTTVLNTLALQNGASILRVHDVKEAMETVKLFTAYKNAAL